MFSYGSFFTKHLLEIWVDSVQNIHPQQKTANASLVVKVGYEDGDIILHFGCVPLLGTVATRIIPVLVGDWPLINVQTCGKPELEIAGMHAKDSPVQTCCWKKFCTS